MSISNPITSIASDAPPWPVRRFTVEEYQRLGELGILAPEESVELLEGWIVEKMNHRPAHGSSRLGLTPADIQSEDRCSSLVRVVGRCSGYRIGLCRLGRVTAT